MRLWDRLCASYSAEPRSRFDFGNTEDTPQVSDATFEQVRRNPLAIRHQIDSRIAAFGRTRVVRPDTLRSGVLDAQPTRTAGSISEGGSKIALQTAARSRKR